jgi:hypothetical protein
LWKYLPAARLGQRAASAFVATPIRQQACADQLTSRARGFYLNSVGLFAQYAGDLVTAREYLTAAVQHERDANDALNLARALMNLTECLGWLGEVEAARQAAAESATYTAITGLREIGFLAGYQGWVAMLAGDSHAAEEHFLVADRIWYSNEPGNDHLAAGYGGW